MSDSEPLSQASTDQHSSPPPSSDPPASPHTHEDHTTSRFAFLNHSALTFPRNLPPDVDNKRLARQRRRRTSPEDAAILEAEYQNNTKPNKLERIRIAGRVEGAFGEKEIQIWFQNRRSTGRKRALPDGRPSPILYQAAETGPKASPALHVPKETSESAKGMLAVPLASRTFTWTTVAENPTVSAQRTSACSAKATEPVALQREETLEVVAAATPQQSLKEDCEQGSQAQHLHVPVTSTPISLKRKQSGVRLSMTSDGAAQLLQEGQSTPSPPRPSPNINAFNTHQPASPTLRRSSSAMSANDMSLVFRSSQRNLALRRQTSGRSRDSRAWEFWCDADARQELARKAEQDQAGSAVDAISNMRLQSRKVLTCMSFKAGDEDDGRKHKKQRPSLHRAMSSTPWLGGSKTHKKGLSKFDFLDEESDKENRDPNRQSRTVLRRSEKSSTLKPTQASTLRASKTAPVPSTQHRNRSHGDLRGIAAEEDEVARFMKGGDNRAAKDGLDMDCIQGLLSLSQGNWK